MMSRAGAYSAHWAWFMAANIDLPMMHAGAWPANQSLTRGSTLYKAKAHVCLLGPVLVCASRSCWCMGLRGSSCLPLAT